MSGPSKILGETQRVWICVLKMSDLTGPRRRADRPRVLVKALTKRPGLELDRWVKTSRRSKRMRVVNVVYEAMPKPSEPGGQRLPIHQTHAEARGGRCYETAAATTSM